MMLFRSWSWWHFPFGSRCQLEVWAWPHGPTVPGPRTGGSAAGLAYGIRNVLLGRGVYSQPFQRSSSYQPK